MSLWRIAFDEARFEDMDQHFFSFGSAYKVNTREVGWCSTHDAMFPWGDTEHCYVDRLWTAELPTVNGDPCNPLDALTVTPTPKETG